jgi:hypothetical protein
MATSVNTEEYNGTSWATVNNMYAHKREGGSAGTQTAGFAAGGNGNPSASQWLITHEYDGTNWTVGGAILTKRNNNGTWGSLTAGLTVANGDYSATSETYDGTCWSAGDDEPTGKANSYGIGQSTGGTSGLHHGGETSGGTVNTTYKYGTALAARTITNS